MSRESDPADNLRDAAALVQAIRRGDREAREVVLAHADHEAVAEVLATVLGRLLDLAGLADWWQADIVQHTTRREQR